ncbi:unnamed protein product [Symbiodinium sp. CCMP2456]|nr:unnamed protein product [Symbiodinium sp. CCMP2456]
MASRGTFPDVVAFNATLAALSKQARWMQAINVLHDMCQSRYQPDVVSANAAASACERGSAWQRALAILHGGLGRASEVRDLAFYGIEASAIGRGRRWAESLQVLLRAHASGLRPTQTLFNIVLASCEHAGSWLAAIALLEEMRVSRMAGLISFNTCMAACAAAAQWRQALDLLAEVQSLYQPDCATMGSSITALAKGQQWHRALELLQGFSSQSLQPNQVVVNACISAAEAGRQWPWALELLFFSKKELRPDIITYNTAVSACEKSSEWQKAFQLLRELQDRRLQPDSTSYGATILAAVSARPMQWTAAFSLLEEMMGRRITPQLATFTQLLMECELRGLAERERSLLLALPEALEASAASASAVTETSASATREDVSQLVLHVAAQKCLLSGDPDRCTEFLRRLDRAGLWNPLAEALWLRAKGNHSGKNRAEGETPSSRARAPPEGLRAGRAKELRLCRHVFASASMDAKSVCEAMEDFGHRLSQQGLWLKLAAGAKGDLLVSALTRAPAGPVLEIGSYCGYSAIRLALSGRGVVTLETDPIHAVIARNMVMMAGLDHRVDVRIGHSKDILPRLGKFDGDQKFAFVFMDQKGSRFHEDLKLLADRDLLCDGAVVVADNVLKPGAPIFLYLLAEAAKRGDSATEIVELQEFAMPAEDWMSVTTLYRPRGFLTLTQREAVPAELWKLHAASERIRTQAMGQGVTFNEWSLFNEDARLSSGSPKGAEPPTGAESPTGAPLLGFGVVMFTVTLSQSSLLEGSVSMGVSAKTDERLHFLSIEHSLLLSVEKAAKRSDAEFLQADMKLGGALQTEPSTVALAAEGKHGAGKSKALAVAKKIGATRKEVQRLKMDRAELLAKLSSQQQALDKVNFEIRQHSEHVEELKERSQNLEEMMANMDQADTLQVQKATQESERIQSFFASMNKEIQKAREKKANLDARIAQLTAERQKEEQRAKNQAQEARAVATEVEQANNELADVKQEISKLDAQIQAQQSKEEKMKNELQQEQVRYQQELKDKAIREQQIEGLTTELAAKSKAASSLEARYIKLQRKARAAKRLLEKEKAKAKEQEKEAQDQLQREKAKAEAQAHEDAAELQRVQEMLQKEAKLAKESFAEEVKRVENKHLKEVKEQEQKIAHQVEIEKGQIREKVSQLQKELAHEQKVGQDQAAEASKKEEALRAELRKSKEAAEEKAQSTKKRMADMQSSLDSQRKASAEKVQAANLNLQKVQEEVVEEEQALASKKAELRRIEKEAKSMEERADLAERQAQQKEAHLQAKIRAANLMERRGKTALQRQAEHQVLQRSLFGGIFTGRSGCAHRQKAFSGV